MLKMGKTPIKHLRNSASLRLCGKFPRLEEREVVAESYEVSQARAVRSLSLFLGELALAQPCFDDNEADVYMSCHLVAEGEPSRRVLVVSDKHSPIVRVCIEAAYELFEGDIHHHVQRIGTVNRDETGTKLVPLVREAYDRLMAWKPTHENIWDYVF